jgi:hypothetical protein
LAAGGLAAAVDFAVVVAVFAVAALAGAGFVAAPLDAADSAEDVARAGAGFAAGATFAGRLAVAEAVAAAAAAFALGAAVLPVRAAAFVLGLATAVGFADALAVVADALGADFGGVFTATVRILPVPARPALPTCG